MKVCGRDQTFTWNIEQRLPRYVLDIRDKTGYSRGVCKPGAGD